MPKNKTNEIRLVRTYDAPLEAVWDAWTDPNQAAQWWGPRGFTLTTHSKDLRPGGFWIYTMHGPDGVDYPNKAQYLEVEEHSKLVYDHGANDDRPALFRVTVFFSHSKGKTQIDMTMSLATAEAADQTRKFIKKVGGESTWDRLAEYLEKESSGVEKFVINRAFDAPLELMFQMWTDPTHLSQWLPPVGFRLEFIRADIRTGGSTFFCMMGKDDTKMYARADYVSIQKPDRIVYKQQFCGADERPARHPMAPTWPETMLTTIELVEEEPGRTRVTVTWVPHGTVTREEMETFVKGRAGMTQGWTGSFDKLEERLGS